MILIVTGFLLHLSHRGKSLNTARDIAGAVASITEDDPGVLSEELPTTPLVNRDSSTRRASCLDVQFDVADFCFLSCRVRRREAAPALNLVASLPLWLARTVHFECVVLIRELRILGASPDMPSGRQVVIVIDVAFRRDDLLQSSFHVIRQRRDVKRRRAGS